MQLLEAALLPLRFCDKMDSIINWKPTEDIDSLIKAILECKKDLTKSCFSKYGSAKIIDFNVFASSKVCDFLMMSELSKPPSKEDGVVNTEWQKYVSNFELFKLHKYKHVDNETIRVITSFDVDEGAYKIWYGDVIFVEEVEKDIVSSEASVEQ